MGKTHRLLVVDEGWAMCGVGAELGQAMNELAFDELDAPVARLHTEPLSHPLAPALERAMLVDADKIVEAARGVSMAARRCPGTGARPRTATPPCRGARSTPAAAPRPAAPLPPPAPPSRRSTASRSPCRSATSPSAKARSCAGRRRTATRVKAGELVAEIETDKAVVEIEAPVAGILARIEQPDGAVVKMGGRIGVVRPA